jgi:hypothetical protein
MASPLSRLAAVSPETQALREIESLPPGSTGLAPVLEHIAKGSVKPTRFLRAYTECVRTTLCSRIDGRDEYGESESVSSALPGLHPPRTFHWTFVGEDEKGLAFVGGRSSDESLPFTWHRGTNTYTSVADAAEVDALLDILFLNPPSLANGGISGPEVPGESHAEQEARMWHCYHTLVDLWSWLPGEPVRFGPGEYTVGAGPNGAWRITLSLPKEEGQEFLWNPAANTLEASRVTEAAEAMRALFVFPPTMVL